MNQLFKRVGALLLVLAMVVGMLPVSAFANEQTNEIPLTVQILKVDLQAQWEAKPEAERGTEPANRYAYKAVLVDSTVRNEVDIKYEWAHPYTTEELSIFNEKTGDKVIGDTYYSNDDSNGVAVKVTVDGLTQLAAIAAGASNYNTNFVAEGTAETWKMKTNLATVQYGVPFTLPEAEPMGGSSVAGATVKCVDTVLSSNVTTQNGKYIVTSEGTVSFKREIYAGVGADPQILRQTEIVAAQVVYPNYGLNVSGKGPGEHWIANTGAHEPPIRVENVAEGQLIPMPVINGTTKEGTWAQVSGWLGMTFTPAEKFTLTAPYTVSVGGESVTIKADKTEVSVTNAVAYTEGDNTIITFKATTGESGIGSVKLNGNAVSYESIGEGAYKITYNGILSGNQKITVTSKSGNTDETSVTVAGNLSIGVEGGPGIVIDGYVKEHKEYTVTIGGLTDAVTVTSLKLGENDLGGARTFSSELLEQGAKTLTVTDSLGRSAEYPLPQIKADAAAPVVTTPTIESGYKNAEQTLTFTVTEEGVGLETGAYVSYTMQGDSEARKAYFDNGAATITVTNGQTLTSYVIKDLQDKLGNVCEENGKSVSCNLTVDTEAPVVVVTFNSNVRGIYTDPDTDQIFLLVPPVENLEAGDAEVVELIATITDANLNGNATYRISMSVDKHSTNAMTYNFTAIDFAENKATKAVLKAGDMEVEVDALEDEPGVFNRLLAVDRRLPSELSEAGIPSVTPVAAAAPAHTYDKNGEEVPVFKDQTIVFTYKLTDAFGDGKADSGMVDPVVTVTEGLSCVTTNNGDVYTTTVTVPENFETKDAKLKISVGDKAGNKYTFVSEFAVDNKAPVVNLPIPTPDAQQTVDGKTVYYYKNGYTINATVEDLFLAENSSLEFPIHGKKDVNSIQVSAKDKAGHETVVTNEQMLIVDENKPDIRIEYYVDGESALPTPGYYNKELTYKFVIDDAYLDNSTILLHYIIGGNNPRTVTVNGAEFHDNNSVTLVDGEYMEACIVRAKDYAGNEATLELTDADKILVDTTAPILMVEKSTPVPEKVYGKTSYYNAPVTYLITVEDDNLDQYNAAIKLTDEKGNEIVPIDENGEEAKWNGIGNRLQYSFVLGNGQRLEEMKLTVMDKAGNVPVGLEQGSNVTFSQDSSLFTYSGNQVVVDTAKPSATLSFAMAEDIEDVVLNGFGFNTETGMNYLKLKSADGAEEIEAEEVVITATLVVKDSNLNETLLTTAKEGQWTPDTFSINSDANIATYTKTVKVAKDDTADFSLDLSVTDLAGNALEVQNVTFAPIANTAPTENADASKAGKLVIDMAVDFRKPTRGEDDEAPNIIVSPDRSIAGTSANGLDLFNGAFNFNTAITDNNKNAEAQNSGLASVVYSLTDEGETIEGAADRSMTIENGKVTEAIAVEVRPDGYQESNKVVLSLFAADHAGNGIRYVKNFAIDTLAPRISGVYGDEVPNVVNGVSYFKEDRQLTVTVTDINSDLSEEKTVVATTGTKSAWSDEKTMTVDFSSGEHTFAIESTDLAGNKNENTVTYDGSAPTAFIIDKAAPVVEITRSFAGKQFTDGATDYLDQDVTYNFKVTDQYLDSTNLNGQVVEIRYTINGEETVIALGSEKAPAYEEVGGMDVYTHSFKLSDGDVLSALSVKAVDNALNSFSYDMAGNAWNDVFTGHSVVVDKTAPVVQMVRTAAAKNQTANGHDFYNGEVTYTFTVTDTNLNGSSTGFANAAAYVITVNGVTAEPNVFAWSNDGTKMTAQFTVADGQTLDSIDLQIKDAAGNPAKLIATQATAGEADAFKTEDAAEGKFAYAGNPVVVDTTAPTAHLTVVSDPADELLNYYTDANGVCYVKLKTPTNNTTVENEVTVKLQLEVSDRNLTAIAAHKSGLMDNKDNTNKNWAAGAGNWSENYLVNNDGTAVYTRTVTVKPDKTGQIIIDLNVEDLAGNKIAPAITMESINGTTPANNPLKADNGNVKGILTLDRRQPTTGNDTAAPYISVVPSITNISKTKNGTVLYNSGLDFELVVTDGANNTLNAGLKPHDETGMGSVTWKLTNDAIYDASFVKATGVVKGTETDSHNHKETITVAAGTGECNHFELTVTAVDNVGNTIVYTEVFAIDTQAPRVTVSYDNNDVRNEKYFKADRTATVTVEDINFNSDTTKIETEIDGSGWVQNGDRTFVNTYVYRTDGDYTFKMYSTDLAKNNTANEAVTYQGVATDKFTIDKTAPVIELKYSPDDMSKTDVDKVVYYAQNQTVSVVIKEHNFKAGDVIADMYINRDNPLGKNLGNFAANGDIYTAKAEFDQGNRYRMTVDYTDLAGNPAEARAETHIFSVDKTAPVISITNSDMKTGALNVVAEELELGFRIEDGQDNLKKYQVVITHLNNSFVTETYKNIEKDDLAGDGRKSITINLDDIPAEKANDGLYTVKVVGWDYADNRIELLPELVFSLNRFGSTFTTEDAFTKQFLTPGNDGVVYHSSVDGNLVFQEINPNCVFSDETMKDEGSSLTIIVNGRSVRLNKGTDYTVKVEQQGEGQHKWYVYTYEIDKSVFLSEGDLLNGRYSILIYGVDEAANDNTNESNEFSAVQVGPDGQYTGKIEFVLDNKAPVIITTGIDAGEVYNEEYRRMEIEISDSTPAVIQVYLNNEPVALRTDVSGLSNDQPWMVKDEATGIYTLNVNEQNGIFASQTVRIEATDAAGNTADAEIAEFHISTSFIVRMINSVWFYVALVSVGAVGIFLAIKARKKVAA